MQDENNIKYSGPGYDCGNIHEYWRGIYSHFYLSFKPFFRIRKDIPFQLQPGQYERLEDKIKLRSRPLPWSLIKRFLKLKSFAALQRGLLSDTDSLEYEAISNIFDYNVIPPEESFFCHTQIESFLAALNGLGHNEGYFNYVIHELGEPIRFELCAEKIAKIEKIVYSQFSSFVTADRKVLITSLFDQHVTMICSDKPSIDYIVSNAKLEGIPVTPDMDIDWSKKTV